MAVEQTSCKNLELGDIVTSADESYVIKDIEIDGGDLIIFFWGAGDTMTVHPDAQLLVERVAAPYEDFIIPASEDPEDFEDSENSESSKHGFKSGFDPFTRSAPYDPSRHTLSYTNTGEG